MHSVDSARSAHSATGAELRADPANFLFTAHKRSVAGVHGVVPEHQRVRMPDSGADNELGRAFGDHVDLGATFVEHREFVSHTRAGNVQCPCADMEPANVVARFRRQLPAFAIAEPDMQKQQVFGASA